ncbi:hypothetical protein F5Y16DRAFT_295681 [Xylariaceae sp. FL0255]|nr:hypothetical protein F5Y16DRAFT_295681 [Xylariaceae sp. FL0255]
METINNMAATAAKAVWGEHNPSSEEPVSGKLGDTSKGEPYDAGNIEHTNTESSEVHDSSTTDHTKSAEFSKNTGVAAEGEETSDSPAAKLQEKEQAADSSAHQGDVRSPEDPKTHPKSATTDVNDAEEGVNEAPEVDGPGPRPLTEIAKEHGGDAGNNGDATSGDAAAEDKKDKPDSHEPKESQGTGEQYVKSTGLQADGGDFDATNPGAGREADRLMEEKGMHPNEKVMNDTDDKEDRSSSPSSEKKSLGQKIKDKLHRH